MCPWREYTNVPIFLDRFLLQLQNERFSDRRDCSFVPTDICYSPAVQPATGAVDVEREDREGERSTDRHI